MAEKKVTFEQAMARLEEIVKQLEQGDAPLEDALALFEEGTRLMKKCTTVGQGGAEGLQAPGRAGWKTGRGAV